MDFIKSISRGTGSIVVLAIAIVLALLFALLLRRSKLRDSLGRALIPFVFIELAVYFFILSLGFGQSDEVGPAVVPRLWIVGIVALNLFLLIRALSGKEPEDPKIGRLDTVLIFAGLCALYLVIMQFLGYFISTFLFTMTGMYILSYKKLVVMISVAAGWLVVSYFAFFKLLYVPLPVGRLVELVF